MLARLARGIQHVKGVPSWGAACLRRYHEKVVEHYNNPRNVGSFDKDDPNVGTGLVGAPACGDVMKLQIRVDEKTGKIVDSCFKTFGCGSAIASSSVGEWYLNATLGIFSKNSTIPESWEL